MNVVGRIIEIVVGNALRKVSQRADLHAAGDERHDVSSDGRPARAHRRRSTRRPRTARSLEPGERWAGIGEPDCVPNPSGGLFSTAGDMDRFYSMILNGGELDGKRIVSADAVAPDDDGADRRPHDRLHARQRLGTRLVHRPRAARRHRHALARHVRPRRRVRHAKAGSIP